MGWMEAGGLPQIMWSGKEMTSCVTLRRRLPCTEMQKDAVQREGWSYPRAQALDFRRPGAQGAEGKQLSKFPSQPGKAPGVSAPQAALGSPLQLPVPSR